MFYLITYHDYHHDLTEVVEADSLEEVKQIAFQSLSNMNDVTIENENRKLLTIARWHGRSPENRTYEPVKQQQKK